MEDARIRILGYLSNVGGPMVASLSSAQLPIALGLVAATIGLLRLRRQTSTSIPSVMG